MDLSTCRVTDHGIMMLCFEENGDVGCSLIEHISILQTNITSSGCRMLLLSQKNLTVLCYEKLILALSYLFVQFQNSVESKSFSLQQLHPAVVKSNSCFEQIHNAVSICPRLAISKIKVEFPASFVGIGIGQMASIPNSNLQKLSFVGSEVFEISFTDIIASFLCCGIGSRLLHLTISHIKNVDTAGIIAICPNLKSLKLFENISYVYKDIPNSLKVNGCVKQLEKFSFTGSDPLDEFETFPPETHISHFLSSPQLMYLKVQLCRTFTDAALETAFQMTRFLNLTFVDISLCNSITNSGLDHFKFSDNSICFFSVHNCENVDTKLLEMEWNSLSKENNWNVEMYFNSEFGDNEEVDDGMQMEND